LSTQRSFERAIHAENRNKAPARISGSSLPPISLFKGANLLNPAQKRRVFCWLQRFVSELQYLAGDIGAAADSAGSAQIFPRRRALFRRFRAAPPPSFNMRVGAGPSFCICEM
jgi:hypothetical protein